MPTEKKHQKEAFEEYLRLGSGRTLKKLHEHYTRIMPAQGKKPPALVTLKYWSKQFNWQERLMLREKEISKGVERIVIEEEITARAQSIKSIQQVIDIAKSALTTAFIRQGEKVVLRPDLNIKNLHELREVAQIAVRGEEVKWKIIEPEETVHMKGEIKYSIPEGLEAAMREYDELIHEIRKRETKAIPDDRS